MALPFVGSCSVSTATAVWAVITAEGALLAVKVAFDRE